MAIAQPRVFQDPGFGSGVWRQLPTIQGGAGGTSMVTLQSSGGNPGPFYQFGMTVNDGTKQTPSTVANVLINTNAVYNPAVDGPISSLDYAEDDLLMSGGPQFTGLALRQNGTLFVLPNFVAPSVMSWTTTTRTTITAFDLSQLDSSTYTLNGGSHPDFSATGGAIEFGFWRALQATTSSSNPCYYNPPYYSCPPSSGPANSSQGIANWRVSVNQGAQVLTKANTPNSGVVSDPISTASGEYFEQSADLSLGGPMALRFIRYYSSFLKQSGVAGALGNNWTHNFEATLLFSGSEAVALLFGGKKVRFNQTGSSWTLASAEQLQFQLASIANGFQLLDPRTNLIYTFSTSGALQSIQDRNGNTLTISRSASSPGPDQVSDGLGRSLRFTYTAGKLMRVQDQSGRSVSFSFTGNDLASVTGPDGKPTQYSYASPGVIASKTLPAGNTILTNAFDARGRVTKQTSALGFASTIAYDKPSAGTNTVTDPLAAAFQHAYQGNGNLIGYTDAAGQASVVTYDAGNRPAAWTDRFGDKSNVTYHVLSGRVASYTDAQGNTTKYSYQAQVQGPFTFYNLTRVDYSDGSSTSFTYDNSGNRLTAVDQSGKTTRYSYSSNGQLTTSTNAAGGVTTLAYNADGTLASQVTAAGDKTAYTYDARKRLAQITNPDGTSVTYAYDDRDNLLSITNGRGKSRSLAYDGNGQVQSLSDPTGQTVSVVYDGDQQFTSLTTPGGNTAGFQFDAAGRIKTLTAPTGESVHFGFDSLNRLTSISDCSNKGIGFSYDKEGVVSSIADGTGVTWPLMTDKTGRLTQIASPLMRSFGFTYDKRGHIVSLTDPLGETTGYTRDARGMLSAVSLPGGVTASYQRDSLGAPITITDANGNAWQRTYDAQSRRTSATDPLGQATSYSYDARGRVSTITTPLGTVTLSYDLAGNLVRRLYSDLTDLKFTYDDNDRVVSANGVTLGYDLRGGIVSSNGIIISRDSSFRISTITYAPGFTVQYSYDCRGLLTQVTDWLNGMTQLAYDDARRLISITRSNGVVTQYTYDLDSRLIGITESRSAALSSISLTRDAVGKITSANRAVPLAPSPAGVIQYSYDAASQVSSGTYDSMGRPSALGLHSFTWDLASRLTSFSGTDGSAAFTYDAYGMRTSRTGGDGSTQNYVINYALPIPALNIVRDGAQNDVRYYVWLPGGEVLYSVEASDSSRRFFHFDEMGSTLFLTDDSGAITDSYGISPYGEQVNHSGTSSNPLTYFGAYGVMEEGSTGLFYMGFRYYDSATARFLSRDPAPGLDPRALNPYQYAFGNPLLFSDPVGQGVRAGRAGDHSEGQFGQFVLGLPYRTGGLRGPNERVVPRLAGAILEFLHGRERKRETEQ